MSKAEHPDTKWVRKSSATPNIEREGSHRYEHWYCSNQVYFITARCRDRCPAFASEEAKAVFWDRFEHHTRENLFTPWVTTVIPNHYHVLGYCKQGDRLGKMMQLIHGSVAKFATDPCLALRTVKFFRRHGSLQRP